MIYTCEGGPRDGEVVWATDLLNAYCFRTKDPNRVLVYRFEMREHGQRELVWVGAMGVLQAIVAAGEAT